jgi:hypothetical protein
MTHVETLRQTRRDRYRLENGKRCIDVRVRQAAQLFDSRDPSPFFDRDLDDDFVDYVVSSADELPPRTSLILQIRLGEPLPSHLSKESIQQAIATHFSYIEELTRRKLTRVLRTGQVTILLGLVVLMLTLSFSDVVLRFVDGGFGHALRRGVEILGWVALWKPTEIILYDWWPLIHDIRLYRKLSGVEVQVIQDSHSSMFS